MGSKRVIIIGAGVGGLATGCYLQMTGYNTEILEMGHECGGVTVPWKRGDYLFDGGTNWIPGSSPNSPEIHKILSEILDFSTLEFIDNKEFMQIEDGEETFHVYTNADELEKEMLRISPQDSDIIKIFISAIKTFSKLKIPWDKSPALMSPIDFLIFPFANISMIKNYMKWHNITIKQFSEKFKSKQLASMFNQILPHHEFFSVLGLLISMGWMHAKSAGYLKGGSRLFIDTLEKKYRNLGGKIKFNTKVTSIEIDNNKAIGVTCQDGTSLGSDHVVSSADRYSTLYKMLNGKYLSNTMKSQFNNLKIFPGMLQVSLGINQTFEKEPSKLVLPLIKPIKMGKDTVSTLLARICNFDDCFAPENKTSFVIHLRTSDPNYWINLRRDNPKFYKKQKKIVLEQVIKTLEKRFDNIKNNIEQTDVATPATWERYTAVWQGSYQGWAPTPQVIGKSFERNIPNLKNFHLTGQWVSPAGGLPRCIVLGKQTAQIICKQDRRKFVITK